MLLDSNILILGSKPEGDALRQWVRRRRVGISAASYVEVLGYPKLNDDEERVLRRDIR